MSAHILIIDDEKTWLQNLVFVLRYKQYEVTAVETGREGLALIQNNPTKYAVILLDLMLTDISGLEVLYALQASEATRNVPVVLQTGSEDMPPILEALELGALCCLRKPYNHRMLYPLIEQILKGETPEKKVLSLSSVY